MTTTRRRTLLLLGATSLTACAPGVELVTRSETDPFEGGIGGTGIVGPLTGFGSLLINGLRVELDGGTTIRTAYGRQGSDALAPGQVLTIAARRTSERMLAREVSIDYALVGPLRHAAGRAFVNNVRLLGWPPDLGHASPGTRVAISGVWTAHGVRADRVDPAPDSRDLIAGTAERNAAGGLRIGGVDIATASLPPGAGRYVVAIGRSEQGGFVASELRPDRFFGRNQLRQLSVDGYLEAAGTAPGFRIAGLGHNFARDVRLGAIGSRRALYFGRYDGLFGASRSYLVPDAFASRVALLQPGLDARFDGPLIRL